MTDQQRTTRIEFVEKLLLANGFEKHSGFSLSVILCKKNIDIGIINYVNIYKDEIMFYTSIQNFNIDIKYIPHDQPLKPLRDFIKLSNQK